MESISEEGAVTRIDLKEMGRQSELFLIAFHSITL